MSPPSGAGIRLHNQNVQLARLMQSPFELAHDRRHFVNKCDLHAPSHAKWTPGAGPRSKAREAGEV